MFLREPILHHADDKPKIRERSWTGAPVTQFCPFLNTDDVKNIASCPRQLSTFNFKYNIGERLRLSGTRKTITIIEWYHNGSSHHVSSVNEQKIISSKNFKRPCDSPVTGSIWSRPKMWIFPCFWKKRLCYRTPDVYIFCNCKCRASSSLNQQSNKYFNNAQFSWHQTFSRRLIFPVSTPVSLNFFFLYLYCIGSAVVVVYFFEKDYLIAKRLSGGFLLERAN